MTRSHVQWTRRRDANDDVQRRISNGARARARHHLRKAPSTGAASPCWIRSGRPVGGGGEFGLRCLVEGRTIAVNEAAVTVNGVDTLSKLDLSGRGSEIDAALGIGLGVPCGGCGRQKTLH